MKIKELKEILKHYEDGEYDDWEIKLWDYNNQRELVWNGGSYAASKPEKYISFPIKVDPVDGVTIEERVKKLYNEIKAQENGTKETEGN